MIKEEEREEEMRKQKEEKLMKATLKYKIKVSIIIKV